MQQNNPLIVTLQNCVAVCEYCANACLDEDNLSSMTACIKLNRDCADLCTAAILLLIRDSSQKVAIVKLCKKICAECAAECSKHEHEHCQQCAQTCHRCEERCHKYLDQ